MPENNKIIKKNYLILDKYIYFLNKNNKKKKTNKNILNIGVKKIII
jgi:hypothetical protein